MREVAKSIKVAADEADSGTSDNEVKRQQRISGLPGPRTGGESPMATYRMVYGDGEHAVTETFDDIDEVEREEGWLVLFRGRDAILRVQEIHVKSIELLDT